MNCRDVQRHLHEISGDPLSADATTRLHRHLADCSDCRVAQQRALRLQQLLTVKRHETPGADYFDNFLGEFHQRLTAATRSRTSFWGQWMDRWQLRNALTLRYGFVHALGMAFVIALVWRGIETTQLPVGPEPGNPARLITEALTPVPEPAPSSTPRTIASALPARGPETLRWDQPIFELLPVAARADFSAPRYVLDRIQATPATYEVASIHF
jgi:hypothetical protein